MRDYTIPYTWSSKYFKKSLSVRCVANICCVRKWFAFCASISAISAETPELYAIVSVRSPLLVTAITPWVLPRARANEDCSSRRPCQWRLRTAYRDQHSRKSSPARNFNMHKKWWLHNKECPSSSGLELVRYECTKTWMIQTICEQKLNPLRRWLHQGASGSTNCYTGNEWDKSICPDAVTCSQACALDGADYAGFNRNGCISWLISINLNFPTYRHVWHPGQRQLPWIEICHTRSIFNQCRVPNLLDGQWLDLHDVQTQEQGVYLRCWCFQPPVWVERGLVLCGDGPGWWLIQVPQ